ncbi:MAG: hypothetical protein IPG78_05590 [Ignavibacteria bacterium]|nr:hypothetical protein [Ignavibacteria bacterium]
MPDIQKCSELQTQVQTGTLVILPSSVATPFCDRVTFIGDTGWTASWGNIVFKTTNYGVSWDSITRIPRSNSSDATYCIEFSNKNTGYSGGDNGKIYRTTNGVLTGHCRQI